VAGFRVATSRKSTAAQCFGQLPRWHLRVRPRTPNSIDLAELPGDVGPAGVEGALIGLAASCRYGANWVCT
jgi:hypothetical protein